MEEIELYPSLMGSVMQDFHKKACSHFDNHIKNYVTKNLKDLGFEFSSEAEFVDFISERVTRINHSANPIGWQLWLDINTDNKKMIGIYYDKVSFTYDGTKITATFGINVG
jgi:hypothetical protein